MDSEINSTVNKKTRYSSWLLVIVFLIILYISANSLWPAVGIDWRETYYPAARAALRGENPYQAAPTFRNVPWTLIPMLPLAFFSERVSGILYFILTFAIYALVAVRLKASRVALLAFLFSSPVVYGMRMLNVDMLVLLGFTPPPQIGLFFILIKPQVSIVMIPFWIVECWRDGGWRSILRTFLPVTMALMLSFALFGLSSIGRSNDLLHSTWNASLWPWAFPIGFALTILSIRNRRTDQAMGQLHRSSRHISPIIPGQVCWPV